MGVPLKTKKTKHGNLYNDRSALKNNYQKTRFFFYQLSQFFIVMYKIWHYRTMKLHQRAHKTTKKKKHGNLYNDLANVQKSCFWELFFYVDRSLYKFPCFVFLVILEKRPCNVIIHSCLILCKTIKNWQNEKFVPTHEKFLPRQLWWFEFWGHVRIQPGQACCVHMMYVYPASMYVWKILCAY